MDDDKRTCRNCGLDISQMQEGRIFCGHMCASRHSARLRKRRNADRAARTHVEVGHVAEGSKPSPTGFSTQVHRWQT